MIMSQVSCDLEPGVLITAGNPVIETNDSDEKKVVIEKASGIDTFLGEGKSWWWGWGLGEHVF